MKGLEITELEAFRDARGWNAHPLDESLLARGEFKNLHLVSMEPGAVRGNHLHTRQTETIFAIGGPCLAAAADVKSGDVYEQVLDEGALFRIVAAPGVPHAFKNISSRTIYLLCASDAVYDPENPDWAPFVLLK